MRLTEILHQQLFEEVQLIMEFIRDVVIERYEAQGHSLTHSLADTAKIEVAKLTNGVIGVLWLNDYWEVLNTGVTAENIPFDPGSGKSKSAYIDGLTEYFKLRLGVSEDEAKSFAFATAYKHLQEGMPTKASERFSQTGKRTGFLTDSVTENAGEITMGIQKIFSGAMSAVLEEMNRSIKANVQITL